MGELGEGLYLCSLSTLSQALQIGPESLFFLVGCYF